MELHLWTVLQNHAPALSRPRLYNLTTGASLSVQPQAPAGLVYPAFRDRHGEDLFRPLPPPGLLPFAVPRCEDLGCSHPASCRGVSYFQEKSRAVTTQRPALNLGPTTFLGILSGPAKVTCDVPSTHQRRQRLSPIGALGPPSDVLLVIRVSDCGAGSLILRLGPSRAAGTLPPRYGT